MSHTLYILTKTGQKEQDDFLTYIQQQSEQENQQSSLVFTQDVLPDRNLSGENMYIIQEDNEVQTNNIALNTLAYHDLLGLIFSSDNIVVM
ncbi:MAG: hypothetical protein NPIRA04_14720 [Nitrospirales bacterium]|nr:MAG: hypothetical protein NPIRA04_14720 [Nitrospirales bacterium]